MTVVADWTFGPEHLSPLTERVDKAIGPRIKRYASFDCDTTIKSSYLLIHILITYYVFLNMHLCSLLSLFIIHKGKKPRTLIIKIFFLNITWYEWYWLQIT